MTRKYSPYWKSSIVTRNSTLRDSLKAISSSGSLMAIVVDSQGKPEGILTDSDIRNLLLAGFEIESPIGDRLNKDPLIAGSSLSTRELVKICLEKGVRELPLCDESGSLTDIFVLGRNLSNEDVDPEISTLPNAMFLSAGGRGTRLAPIVSDRPKPLAEVGGKPIIETIINRATSVGIRNFYVSVNYMADMIESHLKSPQYDGLCINIVKENSPLGTAGALGYISQAVSYPLLVTNSDILTNVPYNQILKSHEFTGADITCVVRPFQSEVPFGVVNVSDGKIVGLSEKPSFSYLVNAGIYVVSVNILKHINSGVRLDMPDLIEKVISNGGSVRPFFLHEYWKDIGRPSDFIQANKEYEEHFGDI